MIPTESTPVRPGAPLPPRRAGRRSTSQQERRRVLLLRGLLIAALASVIIHSGDSESTHAALAILLFLGASHAALLIAPPSMAAFRRFELLMGGVDILLLSGGVALCREGPGSLAVFSLLMALIVAVAGRRAHGVAGAAAVGAMYVWLAPGPGLGAPAAQLAGDLLLLFTIGVYCDAMVERIRRTRRREDAEDLERGELLTLLRILDTIASSLDLRLIAQTIVSQINAVVPSMRCSMLLVDEGASRCRVVASHDDPDIFMLDLDLEKYPEVRQAIERQEPLIINDVAHDPLMTEVRVLLRDLDCRSIMVMPVTFGHDVLGTLLIKTTRPGQAFTRKETNFCLAVARASASALKNALLHRASREEAERHRRTAMKLESILHHSPDLILTTDGDGVITEFSHGGEILLGLDRARLLGKHARSLLAPGEDPSFVDADRPGGTLTNHACRLRTRSGDEVSMEFSLSTLRNDAAEVEGSVWIGRDVTELKAAQLQLMQAEKLSTIGSVISEVAHELNNPLTTMLGFSQLLASRCNDPSMRNDLDKISDAARRSQRIVNNLLSFSRVHKPERKYLGVNGIIEKTLELKRYPFQVANITVVKALDEHLPRTMLDFHQVEQVFLNLFNNAEHAMSAPGSPGGELRIRTWLEEGSIQVEVRDTGHGMSQETMRRIFDPFYTTKEEGKGTGLGLSVSYGIIQEHGGTIKVESREGKGTTFIITLPVTEDPAHERVAPEDVESAKAVAVEPRSDGNRRILVVDDEPTILDLLIVLLEESGYKVDTAANGEEALRKSLRGDYDVIVSDIKMPRMSGIDFFHKLRQEKPHMARAVIFVSGDLLGKETAAFVESEQVPHLPKPIDMDALLGAIDDVLAAAVT